jgi:uncharacterized paraquat-inducible protein A
MPPNNPNLKRKEYMSLVICKECGGNVSSNAPTCPHCGAVVKKVFRNRDSCMGCLIIAMLLFIVAIIYASCDSYGPK